MINIDAVKVEELVRRVAAECIMPRYLRLSADEIIVKDTAGDFVTVADIEAEKEITLGLRSLYPGAAVIGEEGVFENPTLLDVLAGDDPVFVIDPIDGTSCFKDGGKNFGVMIAYAVKGEIKAGWIYIPLLEKMAVGEIGAGVYINGVRQWVAAKTEDVAEMTGVADYTTHCFDGHVKSIYWTRSAALAYTDFIENKADFISFISRDARPWDHMAGVMLAKEAGAYVRTLSQKDYDYRKRMNYLIIAACRNSFTRLRDIALGQ